MKEQNIAPQVWIGTIIIIFLAIIVYQLVRVIDLLQDIALR